MTIFHYRFLKFEYWNFWGPQNLGRMSKNWKSTKKCVIDSFFHAHAFPQSAKPYGTIRVIQNNQLCSNNPNSFFIVFIMIDAWTQGQIKGNISWPSKSTKPPSPEPHLASQPTQPDNCRWHVNSDLESMLIDSKLGMDAEYHLLQSGG